MYSGDFNGCMDFTEGRPLIIIFIMHMYNICYNCAKSVLSGGLMVHPRNFHSRASKSTVSITSRLAMGLCNMEGLICDFYTHSYVGEQFTLYEPIKSAIIVSDDHNNLDLGIDTTFFNTISENELSCRM